MYKYIFLEVIREKHNLEVLMQIMPHWTVVSALLKETICSPKEI